MPNLQIPHLDFIAKIPGFGPRLAESLQALQDSFNTIAQQAGVSAQGVQTTPNPPTQLKVTAAGGIFDVAIQDDSPSKVGIAPDYFLEYSSTPAFNAPAVIHLGPARNHRAALGNQTLYWRAYSQNGRASPPSAKTYLGPENNPTPVVGGGAIAGPNLLPSAGSGTAPTSGTQGGAGYGFLPVRNLKP